MSTQPKERVRKQCNVEIKITIAAAKQNKAFDLAEVLYDNQGVEGSGWLTNATVANIAASVDELNLSQFASDANSSATQQTLTAFDRAGEQVSRVVAATGQQPGTPTLLLAKGNGKPKLYGVGLPSLTALESAIDKLLR